jgi:hypothetical protein
MKLRQNNNTNFAASIVTRGFWFSVFTFTSANAEGTGV